MTLLWISSADLGNLWSAGHVWPAKMLDLAQGISLMWLCHAAPPLCSAPFWCAACWSAPYEITLAAEGLGIQQLTAQSGKEGQGLLAISDSWVGSSGQCQQKPAELRYNELLTLTF